MVLLIMHLLDDEYITIAEEFDLSYAIHTYKILRLKIISELYRSSFRYHFSTYVISFNSLLINFVFSI